ncbi:ubiquinol oxidase subunit II [Photobacterium arenosum]|uniref:ubiquinol oxidase subunit II n=1 Tax=Photobacterium arenosum TaxID=2774143 RepID=UPI00288B1920|nr:ubiquinol oxidase subunit II [Photobacterium arenosum]
MKTSRYKNILSGGVVFFISLFLSGCQFALLDPKGQIGAAEKDLIITSVLLMLVVVIPVILMTFYFSFKYRESNTGEKYTPEWAHSTKIELVVWTVPIIIIAILGTITWQSTHALDPRKPIESSVKPMTIEVVSLDWKWLFIYPDQHIATINEVAFPKNVPVEFRVTSNSVMNSFFIPQLGSQIYAMAGMLTKVNLIADEAGVYDGISASYSGHGFSGMKFKALAMPDQASFDEWVQKAQASSDKLVTLKDFETIAEPSENAPVSYYSNVPSSMLTTILNQFEGSLMCTITPSNSTEQTF